MTWCGHALLARLSAGLNFFTSAWIIFMVTPYMGAGHAKGKLPCTGFLVRHS